MNPKGLLGICVLASATVFCFSCSKKDSSKTRQELILNTWQVSAVMENPAVRDYDSDGIKDADAYKFGPACNKDDYFTFKVGGIVEENRGTLKCSDSQAQLDSYEWNLSADGNTLTLEDQPSAILQLDANTLKLSTADTTSNGTPYTTVTTLVRK